MDTLSKDYTYIVQWHHDASIEEDMWIWWERAEIREADTMGQNILNDQNCQNHPFTIRIHSPKYVKNTAL